MDTVSVLLMILGMPMVAGVLIALFFRRRGNVAMVFSITVGLLMMLMGLGLLSNWEGGVVHINLNWLTLGSLKIDCGFLLDYHAALMLLVVTFIGFWIQLFSGGYMEGDESKGRYFAAISFFMFSMIGIVLANNLFMLFIFWELVGFSSYALIAHYNKTVSAAAASKKAFIVNKNFDRSAQLLKEPAKFCRAAFEYAQHKLHHLRLLMWKQKGDTHRDFFYVHHD